MNLIELLLKGHLSLLVVPEGLQPPLDLLILILLLLPLTLHTRFLYGRIVLVKILILTQFRVFESIEVPLLFKQVSILF